MTEYMIRFFIEYEASHAYEDWTIDRVLITTEDRKRAEAWAENVLEVVAKKYGHPVDTDLDLEDEVIQFEITNMADMLQGMRMHGADIDDRRFQETL